MRGGGKKIFTLFTLLILMTANTLAAWASPWNKEQGYGNRMVGKFKFGLKNTLLSWGMIFVEPYEPQYNKEWEGLWVGVSKCVLCTANGMIQLVTFPIPVDFPDLGRCTGLPEKKTAVPAAVSRPANVAPPAAAVLAKPVEPPAPAAPVSAPAPAAADAAKKFIK